jgi:mannitol-1-phosphate 5-dehydrogenase
MSEHIFAGFGFGPIQAGLFAKEAFQSRHFRRIVVAEIDQRLVDAVRANSSTYYVNVAGSDGIETVKIDGVELLNPTDINDLETLRAACSEATEIATCLPSVKFFDSHSVNGAAALIAEGLRCRQSDATIVYAAENHNHAAEILEQAVTRKLGAAVPPRVQFLNTVIGKMSQVVTDPGEIAARKLAPITPGFGRAFLVEAFNRILVSKTTIPGFVPGIEVFIEKADLLPFEEAKLYGHNAIHALLGFIGLLKGYEKMTELKDDARVMHVAREAFIAESGGALIRKHASLGDELFTDSGYRYYAEDLLERMTNPYLADTTARAARDVVRKLGVHDRIYGTMTLAMKYGIEPKNMAVGALAGVALLLANAADYGLPRELQSLNWRTLDARSLARLLTFLWQSPTSPTLRKLAECTCRAGKSLAALLSK